MPLKLKTYKLLLYFNFDLLKLTQPKNNRLKKIKLYLKKI